MNKMRNIAIIAHVDHGKTTLVDKILHQCQLFRDNEEVGELILDSNDLEKERGITIFSKNAAVNYKGYKINIIDTPGHADFGGEVERVLNMADGVVLLVDAFEGAMPQTRYVTSKAIELGLKPIVVINKVDKPNCRPDEVQEAVFELMFNLDATEDQLDFTTVYGSGRDGWFGPDWNEKTDDITFLLDTIIDVIPAPEQREGDLQMQITTLDYSSYVGRIAIGRVHRGTLKVGEPVALIRRDGTIKKSRIKEIFIFDGLGRKKAEEVRCGDLCAVTGLDGFEIGDTITDPENTEALPPIAIDEPTMSMLFTVNNSPFFGKEGDYVTSRHLRDRLFKETEKNLALRIEETASPDSFIVYGRGVLHLSVLIETMRREGYEFQVGQPQVIIREIDGVKSEPVESLVIDAPEPVSGKVIEQVTQRKGELQVMEPKGDLIHMEFVIPSRGLIGIRTSLMNVTAGEAIIAHNLKGYEAWKGEIPNKNAGALVAHESGTSIPFALFRLQDRGKFFIGPGENIYAGMVVGEHIRANDLPVNVVRTKKLTNMRASGSDDKVKIAPPMRFSLEEAMEYIRKDEYIEVTPQTIRMRKIELDATKRQRAAKNLAGS